MSLFEALTGFAAVALVLTLVPGIDTTLVVRSALVQGKGAAFVTTLGIACGALCWGLAAATGVAALLAVSELAYRVVTIAGACYMLYLGVMMIVKSFRKTEAFDIAQPVKQTSLWWAFVTGFGTNLLNPKIGVFYVATIPHFMPEGVVPVVMGVLLASIHALLSIAWLTLVLAGAITARRWLAKPRALRITDRIAGSIIAALGVKLLLDQRTI